MKKIIYAAIIALVLASVAYADTKINAGVLTYLGTTEDEFQESLDDLRKVLAPLIPSEDGGMAVDDMLESFLLEIVVNPRNIRFYDSLLAMQMALRSGKISEIALPEAVGMYLINHNRQYEVLFSLNMMPSTISFGFRKEDTSLKKSFDDAINAMKKDGTLTELERKYIQEVGENEPEEVKFSAFRGAKTIKVAVTGDLPPIDFIAADGRPTGYNTAILSEIGRRLKRNIQLISVDAGGRSAALASGRADVVFWYRSTEGLKTPPKLKGKNLRMKDSLEGVILSVPYYEWDTDLVIGKTN